MNCEEFTNRFDEYREGSLAGHESEAASAHLKSCPRCRDRIEHVERLRAALRDLPVPRAQPGFFEHAVRNAAAAHTKQHRPWAYVGAALAASLALWIGAVSLTPLLRPSPAVTISLNEPRTIQLAFNAERDVSRATIQLQLPEGIEVQGFPGEREIRWQADLARGVNVLPLPLVATSTTGGALLARLEQGGRSTQLSVQLRVSTPERSGASSGRARPTTITG